jgi:hypothetical protein
MPFSKEEELKVRFGVVKALGDTAKSYIQISSAALAIPLLFTEAIFGKNAAEQGLRSVGVPYTVYGSLSCFVLAILAGLIYQWASVRRVWVTFTICNARRKMPTSPDTAKRGG